MQEKFLYRVYGLRLTIDKPLQSLTAVDLDESADVAIHLLPPSDASWDSVDWTPRYDNGVPTAYSQIASADLHNGQHLRLRYSGSNPNGDIKWHEFVINPAGTKIWARWTAPHQDMEAFLLGPVLGHVLRLRGITCLHASVIVVDDQCIALVGDKGAGKSTTAAAFIQAGYPVLSDDMAVLVKQGDQYFVQPGYPRLRLVPDAAMVVASAENLSPVFQPHATAPNKQYLDMGNRFPKRPYPLRGIYFLPPRDRSLTAPFVMELPVQEALMTLVQHTSAAVTLTPVQRAAEFMALGQLIARIPVRRVYRPDSLHTLPTLCATIARDVLTQQSVATLPTETFATTLPCLLQALPTTLASTKARPTLKQIAHRLPPIVQGGFECRLDANPQVDLQQCIGASTSQIALLTAYFDQHAPPTDAVWQRLRSFFKRWLAEWQTEIPEIWLEFDADTVAHASNILPHPALFIGLPQSADDECIREKLIDAALSLLWAVDFPHNTLHRCFAACVGEQFVSHVGVMLSRQTDTVRVNIKRLCPETLGTYLTAIGWQGDVVAAIALMRQLAPLTDRITVCLDVGQTVAPRLGFECILLEQPPTESRWALLLAQLSKWGICLSAKQTALLEWVGAEAGLDRRLSHVKVDFRPNSPLQAKGYLWFSHQR